MAMHAAIGYDRGMRSQKSVPDRLKAALCKAVEVGVGRYGGTIADVWRELDHDGDDAIFVDVNYTRPEIPVDPSDIVRLRAMLRDVALEQDESAILYVHHSFPRDQRIDETAYADLVSGRR